MNIAPFGVAALCGPFVFGAAAFFSRRRRRLFRVLVVLAVLAVLLALATVLTVGGHVQSTSSWSS